MPLRLRHRLCLVFPLPSRLRHRLRLAVLRYADETKSGSCGEGMTCEFPCDMDGAELGFAQLRYCPRAAFEGYPNECEFANLEVGGQVALLPEEDWVTYNNGEPTWGAMEVPSHCLPPAVHCLPTDSSLTFNCRSLPSHCLPPDFSLPFTAFPLPSHCLTPGFPLPSHCHPTDSSLPCPCRSLIFPLPHPCRFLLFRSASRRTPSSSHSPSFSTAR